MITQTLDQLSEHPPSITGANVQCGMDYLRVILPISRSEHTLEALDLLLRDYFACSVGFDQDKAYFCGRYFSHGHRNSDNTCIIGYNWNQRDIQSEGELMLNLSGTLLSRCSFPRLIQFCSILFDMGAHCSRIDFCVDDFSKSFFGYDTLCDAIDSGNFSGCQRKNTSRWANGLGGWLITLGSRANSKFGRFYNKSIESKGLIDSHRFEMEYKDKYAKSLFEAFCTLDEDDLPVHLDFIGRLLAGSFKFIDRTSAAGTNLRKPSRCSLLDWWAKFVDALGGAMSWSVPRIKKSIEKTVAWIEKQVLKSLVVIRKCYGDAKYNNWFDFKLAQLNKKLNPSQINRIDNYILESNLQLSLSLTLDW